VNKNKMKEKKDDNEERKKEEKKKKNKNTILTDMYERVPTNELAIESISCLLTPKSHNLISPRELTRMLDGFTSNTYNI